MVEGKRKVAITINKVLQLTDIKMIVQIIPKHQLYWKTFDHFRSNKSVYYQATH
jgi:hypothetical protein